MKKPLTCQKAVAILKELRKRVAAETGEVPRKVEIINAITVVLGIEENQIKSFETWEKVFFIKFNVGRPTFVSKRKVNALRPGTWTLERRSKYASKMWVAHIVGLDPKYRFDRNFLDGEVLKWDRKGAVRIRFEIDCPGVYHDSEGEYFVFSRTEDGAVRFDRSISWQEAEYLTKRAVVVA